MNEESWIGRAGDQAERRPPTRRSLLVGGAFLAAAAAGVALKPRRIAIGGSATAAGQDNAPARIEDRAKAA